MKQFFLLLLCALSFTGCAMHAPSSAPIHQSISVIGHKIDDAQTHATAAKTHVERARAAAVEPTTLKLELDGATTEIDLLTKDLLAAKKETGVAEQKLTTYDLQIGKLVSEANAVKESRHRWVKTAWYLGAGDALLLIWLFKGPLMSLGGFVLRKFVGVPW